MANGRVQKKGRGHRYSSHTLRGRKVGTLLAQGTSQPRFPVATRGGSRRLLRLKAPTRSAWIGNIMRSNMRRGSYKQWHLHGGSRRKPAFNDLMPHLGSLETPAKARFVVRLVTGASLRSCANALGISYETARRHLQSVFRKTGAHRQVELILR
jgi:DNA-binding CsgD family transcriptional regulator